VKKARELGQEGVRDLPLMELDALKALSMYWDSLPRDDRKVPGEDAKFDARFTAWLEEKSGWVPLRVLLDAKPELLERAGYPNKEVTAFIDAFRALEKAETSSPGTVPATATTHLVAKATTWARRSTRSRTRRRGDGPRGVLQRGEPLLERPVRIRPGADPPGRQPRPFRRAETLFGKFGLGLYVAGCSPWPRGSGWRSSASRCGS
jgi:hypothetical protein